MAWFLCNVGNGGSGVTLTVTCAEEFAGETITCAKTGKSLTKTCPSSSPYTVEFAIPESGTWTVSATVSGTTYTSDAVVIDLEPTTVLNYGFTWQNWVTEGGLDPTDYSSLSDLLADEEALRRLFLVHASVDYMADSATVTTDLATIINDNYCAKWINLSDYALDTLYANNAIASAMDTADKYFYGEWVITDSTTTPVTWGPKGNVPVMTSNTAPYGTASASSAASGKNAYLAFDRNYSTYWQTSSGGAASITYKFTNPIKAKKAKLSIFNDSGSSQTYTVTIKGSNDGTTWSSALGTDSVTVLDDLTGDVDIALTNEDYYIYIKADITPSTNTNVRVRLAQFYGRELSVSVPTMTSNTAPYGEASGSGSAASGSGYWKVFDGDVSSRAVLSSSATSAYVQYKFTNPINVKMFMCYYSEHSSVTSTIQISYSDDGSSFTNAGSTFTYGSTDSDKKKYYTLDDDYGYHLYWRFTRTRATAATVIVNELQFYGLDYSEKEFETGTTKKWLYDHGVLLEETEELSATNGYTPGSGYSFIAPIYYPSHIALSSPGANQQCGIACAFSSHPDVNTFLAKVDSKGVSSANNYSSALVVYANKQISNSIAALGVLVPQSSQKVGYDISNATTGLVYTILCGQQGRAISLYELWLE